MEIWKDIKGYENLYKVSNTGKVMNVCSGKILSGANNGVGYLKVQLFKEKVGKRYYIHRLVATAFCPNERHLPEVNHIDSNPSNNNADNLEWISSSGNTLHAVYTNGFAPWGNAPKRILATNLETGEKIHFKTISEAERRLKTKHISNVLNGTRKSAKGHRFEYERG